MQHTKVLLRKAVEIAGSQAKLAEALGISQQGVSFLMNKADRVSAEIAVKIEQFTDGQILRSELRPDIFGPAPQVAAPEAGPEAA